MLPECGFAGADIAEMCSGTLKPGQMPSSFAPPASGAAARSEDYRVTAEPLLNGIREQFEARKRTRAHPVVRSYAAASSQFGEELPLLLVNALTTFFNSAAASAMAPSASPRSACSRTLRRASA